MAHVGREWGRVATRLGEILAHEEARTGPFQEAASLLGDVADREEAVFEDIADELVLADDRE